MFGGRWCANGAGPCAELSFQEDMVVASSPDFSLRFALLLRVGRISRALFPA